MSDASITAFVNMFLVRYMVETIAANPQLRELESLIVAIQTACKTIASVVDRASITGVTGLEAGGGSINVQGEEQKRLDGEQPLRAEIT